MSEKMFTLEDLEGLKTALYEMKQQSDKWKALSGALLNCLEGCIGVSCSMQCPSTGKVSDGPIPHNLECTSTRRIIAKAREVGL